MDYLSKNKLLYEFAYRETGVWKRGHGTIRVEPVYHLQGWIEELDGNYKYSSRKVKRQRQSDDLKQVTFSELATKMGLEKRLPP